MNPLLQYLCYLPLAAALVALLVAIWIRRFAGIAGWPTTWRYIGRFSTLNSLARRLAVVTAGGLVLTIGIGALGLVVTSAVVLTVLFRWYRNDLAPKFWGWRRFEIDRAYGFPDTSDGGIYHSDGEAEDDSEIGDSSGGDTS